MVEVKNEAIPSPPPHLPIVSCTGQFYFTLSKSEGRGFLEASGPVQACTEIVLIV